VAAIEVQSLSKSYRIGRSSDLLMLRERIAETLRHPFRRRDEGDLIWALRDVSFRIEPGEVVGIIGRNGAGKSTLLKILSRITYPIGGRVAVSGRVASLLEVGTGFHDELTGRENVFLNGSILGMRKRDVERRFESIVEFSGVARFIDTPIKRYSSGMRLRLGFAVAAHLDPDVLVVDEVLAVGDAAFQKKCIGAMENLRSGGRTVLFVSHNMAAVDNLCSRGIWIDAGQVRMDGRARDVIQSYLAGYAGEAGVGSELMLEQRVGSGDIRFTRLEYLAADGTPVATVMSGEPVVMRMHYEAGRAIPRPSFGLRMYTGMGTLVTETSTWHHGMHIPQVGPGPGWIDLRIDMLNLVPGRYALALWVTSADAGTVFDGDVRASLEVELANVYGSSFAMDERHGVVYFPQRWVVPPAGG